MYAAEEDSQNVAREDELKSGSVSANGLGAKRALWIFLCYLVSSLGFAFTLGLCVNLVRFIELHKTQSIDPAISTALGSVATLLGTAIAWNMALHSYPVHARDEFKHALGLRPSNAARILVAACVGLALFLAVGLPILHLFPLPSDVTVNSLVSASAKAGWPRVSWALYAVAVSPASEELMFRGILFAGLVRSTPVSVAAAVTTLMFVLLHVWGLTAYPAALIPIFALGAAAQWARVSSGSLVPAFVVHLIYNLAGVVSVSLQP